MKYLKHIVGQPFVFATGAAALVHSTWALGTLFAGAQPDGWQLVGWLIPALLIAFALDVGQIATSGEIRERGLTAARGVTFFVFAAATYYLQWLYIAHHMPALALAAGVRETWAGFATVMRDAAVWIIPALLPISTLLYTFSSSEPRPKPAVAPVIQIESEPEKVELPALPALQPVKHLAHCDSCGWEKEYDTAKQARAGLSTHQSRYCPIIHAVPSTNGHKQEEIQL